MTVLVNPVTLISKVSVRLIKLNFETLSQTCIRNLNFLTHTGLPDNLPEVKSLETNRPNSSLLWFTFPQWYPSFIETPYMYLWPVIWYTRFPNGQFLLLPPNQIINFPFSQVMSLTFKGRGPETPHLLVRLMRADLLTESKFTTLSKKERGLCKHLD